MKKKLKPAQIFLIVCVAVLLGSLFLPYLKATEEYGEYLEFLSEIQEDDQEEGIDPEWMISMSMAKFFWLFHVSIAEGVYEDIFMPLTVALIAIFSLLMLLFVFKNEPAGVLACNLWLLGAFALENWMYTDYNVYPERYLWSVAYYVYYVVIAAVLIGGIWMLTDKARIKKGKV